MNIAVPIAKKVLGFAMSAIDAGIQKRIHDSGTTILIN